MIILGALVVVWMAGTALVYLWVAGWALWQRLLRVRDALGATHGAVLHLPEDLEDDGLRAARGFAVGLTIAASIWTVWVLVARYWL
jgi:hypothetical protein